MFPTLLMNITRILTRHEVGSSAITMSKMGFAVKLSAASVSQQPAYIIDCE